MSESEHELFIELELVPVPPDTVASVKEDITPLIASILRDGGHEQLLSDGQMQVQVEQTFPTDEIIKIGVTLLSSLAIEVFKSLILPKLKSKLEVRQKVKRGKK